MEVVGNAETMINEGRRLHQSSVTVRQSRFRVHQTDSLLVTLSVVLYQLMLH